MNKTKSIIAALLIGFGVGTYTGYAKHDDIRKVVNVPKKMVEYVGNCVRRAPNYISNAMGPPTFSVKYELINELPSAHEKLYLIKPEKPITVVDSNGDPYRAYDEIIVRSDEKIPSKGEITLSEDPFEGGPTGWCQTEMNSKTNPLPVYEKSNSGY